MKPYAPYLVLFTVVAVGANAVASGASSGSGDGYIGCDLEIPAGSGACGVGTGPSNAYFEIPISAGQTLAVTITWTPVGLTADELSLLFDGWTWDCECSWKTRGPSPLMMQVVWPAEAEPVAGIAVGAPAICPGPFGLTAEQLIDYSLSCTFPPVRVVRDQPFHYEWTVT